MEQPYVKTFSEGDEIIYLHAGNDKEYLYTIDDIEDYNDGNALWNIKMHTFSLRDNQVIEKHDILYGLESLLPNNDNNLYYPERMRFYIGEFVYVARQEFGGKKLQCLVVNYIPSSKNINYRYKLFCVDQSYYGVTTEAVYSEISLTPPHTEEVSDNEKDDTPDLTGISIPSEEVFNEIDAKIGSMESDLNKLKYIVEEIKIDIKDYITVLDGISKGTYYCVNQAKFVFVDNKDIDCSVEINKEITKENVQKLIKIVKNNLRDEFKCISKIREELNDDNTLTFLITYIMQHIGVE